MRTCNLKRLHFSEDRPKARKCFVFGFIIDNIIKLLLTLQALFTEKYKGSQNEKLLTIKVPMKRIFRPFFVGLIKSTFGPELFAAKN